MGQRGSMGHSRQWQKLQKPPEMEMLYECDGNGDGDGDLSTFVYRHKIHYSYAFFVISGMHLCTYLFRFKHNKLKHFQHA